MRFHTTFCSVTISLEELQNLLPKEAVKLITEECHVKSLSDLYVHRSVDPCSILLSPSPFG